MFKENPYYHSIIRKAVISFGDLFSGITIQNKSSDGTTLRTVQVPISWARKQQWLTRLQGDPDFQKKFEVELPRLSFEIVQYQYMPEKKIGNQFERLLVNCGAPKAVGMPVPYRIVFSLSIYAKEQDDILQVTEQILPYFAPMVNINFDYLPEYKFVSEVPITLIGTQIDEDNHQDLNNNRMIIQSFTFAMDVQLFGPVDTNVSVIKKTITDINQMNGHGIEEGTNTVNPRYADKTDTYSIESMWTVL